MYLSDAVEILISSIVMNRQIAPFFSVTRGMTRASRLCGSKVRFEKCFANEDSDSIPASNTFLLIVEPRKLAITLN